MRIISWNVNGLRACVRKGFHEFLESSGADVLCLQEVRALPEQLDQHTLEPVGWYTNFFPAERKGYAGVAIFSREKPTRVITELPEEEFNIEGRYIVAKFGRLSIASIYFPKGSGKDRDNSRVAYKLAFYRSVKRALDRLRASGPTFALGDFNTAHTEIDLARAVFCPKNALNSLDGWRTVGLMSSANNTGMSRTTTHGGDNGAARRRTT